jgi:hypothetical protein
MMHNLQYDWNVPNGSTVIIDESMQLWIGKVSCSTPFRFLNDLLIYVTYSHLGSSWREESLISKGCFLFVMFYNLA